MANNSGPIPTPPAHVVYPWVDFNHVVDPKRSQSFPASSCFYYAGIQAIWITWSVDLGLLGNYLSPKGMVPVPLSGQGAVNVCFFNAACLFGNGSIPPNSPRNSGVYGFNETEVNIFACSSAIQQLVPMNLTISDFLQNGDPTKRIGVYRQWVAADDEAAVAAGQQVYKENKFLASYSYSVPTWNNPGQISYNWTCYAAGDEANAIYSGVVSLAGMMAVPGNMSEWIDLSSDSSTNRVMGSRRTYFGTVDTYFLSAQQAGTVAITFGSSTHPMRTDMQTLLANAVPVAVQVFRSPPVIAEGAPYWADL